jgi:hypothetical protein
MTNGEDRRACAEKSKVVVSVSIGTGLRAVIEK